MANCATFGEQYLDFLYGLLDEQGSAGLLLHVQACPKCQAELKEAEAQQRLLAQAARACADVAPFTAAHLDAPMPAPAAVPVVVPALGADKPRARPARSWIWYGASTVLAASVAIAIFLAKSYQDGYAARQNQVADAKRAVDKADALFEQARERYAEKQKDAVARPSGVMQVQLTGATHFDRQAGATLLVQTRDPSGQPQKANLKVRVVDAATKETLHEMTETSAGSAKITLPAGLKSKENQLQLYVSAQAVGQVANLPPASLQQTEPVYLTHLAMNKSSFFVGELLFFRSVTLEQFSLKPTASEIPLRYCLKTMDGQVVKYLESKTGPGGIAGGEFALTSDIASGAYYLEVVPLKGDNVVPERQRLDIVSSNTPLLVLDKNQYRPGDVAQLTLLDRQTGNPLPDQRVEVESLSPPYGTSGMGGAGGYGKQNMRGYANEQGQVKLPLPKNAADSKAVYTIGVRNRNSADNLLAVIPLVPSQAMIDFFPEGGDLVEGVETWVYYRLRSLQGDPVIPDGQIVVDSSRGNVYKSPPGQGTGKFRFTPSSKETYRVSLSSAKTAIINPNPIAKLGIRAEGVVLSVPDAVMGAQEPIRASLTNKGGARRLLVMVACRGQIVEQQTLLANDGETPVVLNPRADAAGILRVTVYEVKDRAMFPLAERLVFLMPGQRLELSAKIQKEQGGETANLLPGRNSINVQCLNEKRQPVDCFALAAVVDARVAGAKEPDLLKSVYLGSDVSGGEELEKAMVLVHDTPANRKALNLFLGTQGWRRFVSNPAQDLQLARRGGGKDKEHDERQAVGAAIFSQTNASLAELAQLQAEHQVRLAGVLANLRVEFVGKSAVLARMRDEGGRQYQERKNALAEYERLPREYLTVAMGASALLCVAAASLMLLFGLFRMLQQRAGTPAFAGSFVALGLCLIIYMAGKEMGMQLPAIVGPQAKIAAPNWPDVPPVLLALPPATKEDAALLPPGQYALAPGQLENADLAAKRDMLDAAAMAKIDEAKKALAMYTPNTYESQLRSQTTNSLQTATAPLQQDQDTVHKGQRRFNTAALSQKQPDKDLAAGGPHNLPNSAPAAPAVPDAQKELEKKVNDFKPDAKQAEDKAKRGGGQKKDAAMQIVQGVREYRVDPKLPQDSADPILLYPATILWLPALNVKNGTAQLTFDLPELPGSYLLTIQGHTADGRLGVFERTLEVPLAEESKKLAK